MISIDFEPLNDGWLHSMRKIEKGGPGSGIKGHRTHKEDKAHRIIKSFEEKIRNELIEHSLFVDSDGEVILQKNGGEHNISFSEDEMWDIKLADNVVFTHNHPASFASPFSLDDLRFIASKGIKEGRAISKNKLYIVKLKGKISPDLIQEKYEKAYQDKYFYLSDKVISGELTNKEGNDVLFDEVWKRVSKEIDGLEYKKELNKSFSKGGKGSGIKGHKTAKKEKSKLCKVVEDFEEKYRNRISEIGLLVDKKGNVLLIKKGTKTKISYTPEEENIFLHSGKSYLFTHNHHNDTSPSLADFNAAYKAKLKEIRSVGPNNTFILKIKKEIPEKVYFDMYYSFETKHNLFYSRYSAKVNRGEIKATDATIIYSDESMKAFVKEFPEYLHYQKITNIEKGGVGSGIKGHVTEKKYKKKILDFENKIRKL